MEQPLMKTDIKEYKLYARGKVRDVYDLGDKLLIIATDRISAFDWVLPTGIPNKGKILTSMSLFWFEYVSDIVENHLISSDIKHFPENLQQYKNILKGRSMLVKKAQRIDIECVVRGYISGSLWKEYKQASNNGARSCEIHKLAFPAGLEESEKLKEPIFTPATKALNGHDENISFEEMQKMTDKSQALFLKNKSTQIYKKAFDYAWKKGIILADTKFEFGILDEKIILIDELFSPDSSRFWPKEKYRAGFPQESYDKQYIRDYLEKVGWDKNSPPPELPQDVVRNTLQKYKQAHRALVGELVTA